MQRLQRLVEGKYKVERMVGKGGMGAVFLAHDLTLEREVAIKVLPPDISMDEHIVKRFQQEAKTAAKLDHTNIIPIYRVESEGGLNYFVMKYIAGTSLEDVLDQKHPLMIDYIQRVLCEAACALGHAHQRGVVHRDLKPANIWLGDDGTAKLGDFGLGWVAASNVWVGGKIWKIDAAGNATQLASGFRNPFDLAWDPAGKRLIVPDNGDLVDDEINVITTGGFYGWPLTAGNSPPVEGAIPPRYVFPTIVAPTGIVRLSGANPLLSRGYLLGTFVTRGIYYIEDVDATPFPDPVAITTKDVFPVIDVAESPKGDIYFATATTLYRLVPPLRGDCNGDGVVNDLDIQALQLELADGDPHPASTAAAGSYRGSWGCDADGDGLISNADVAALWHLVFPRARAARH